MPLLVFDTKEIPAHRHERIQTAVEAGGKDMRENYAAWITSDPFRCATPLGRAAVEGRGLAFG